MIQPHGNTLVDRVVTSDRAETLRRTFDELPTIELDRNLLFDFSNIASGVYSPLEGFMSRNDFLKVINDLALESGTPWPLPIVLDIDTATANEIEPGQRAGLVGPESTPVGVMDIDDVYRYNEEDTCRELFGTVDEDHPGVRMIQEKGPFFVGGTIKGFEDALPRNGPRDLTPKESRVLFEQMDWETVVGFQTRNVPHRAHEYLQKSSLEHVDGLFIQPKIGEKKRGDYTNEAILEGYDSLIEHYYPADVVVQSMFKSRMWYAGPREAVFDSIVRKNYGCTHFIVGRDHAGVGNYYGDFEAQELVKEIGTIGIELQFYHYSFYCSACDGMVSEKICPHKSGDRTEPSGTDLRTTLSSGKTPSAQLMRPEVVETILKLDEIVVED